MIQNRPGNSAGAVHPNFFPHFYPELKGIVGPHMFGYNKRSHLLHFLLYIPLCAAITGVCMIF